MINVTSCVYHGNGATITFSDNSIVEIVHSSPWDINQEQSEALLRYNRTNCGTKTEDLRFVLGDGAQLISVDKIDSPNGIIYLDNPTDLQIEVYRYTRHNGGPHKNYGVHEGKRYKPYNMLKHGATVFNVPDTWVRQSKRQYLRFATWDNGERGKLSADIVVVTSQRDRNNGAGKILLDDIH